MASAPAAAAPQDMAAAMPPSPDPRVGLRAGWLDAEQTAWNLRLVSNTTPGGLRGVTNSDLAFLGRYLVQGNYNGFQIWDIENPGSPRSRRPTCAGVAERTCRSTGTCSSSRAKAWRGAWTAARRASPDTVSHERLRGIRIFDMSDVSDPKYLGNVQTCRGSHTHTVVTDPDDPDNVYIYVSGSAGSPVAERAAGLFRSSRRTRTRTRRCFRIEVIQVAAREPAQPGS